MGSYLKNKLTPLGEDVQAWLRKRNITQRRLAFELGIHPTAFSRIIRGTEYDPEKIECIKSFMDQYEGRDI